MFLRKTHQCLLAVISTFLLSSSVFAASEKPNILWISCEDISPHLGCYGDRQATTPNLDKLASEGIRFDQAHHIHGVCAPARTGMITAMWPTSLGNSHMRSSSVLPDYVKPFPIYLREAGYYCTNNSKTDYNFYHKIEDIWDESSRNAHWRKRKDKNQPFFSVFNFTTCHESGVWARNHKIRTQSLKEDEFHDPNDMVLPPYYPDNDTTRASMARLYDVITAMDKQVGKILKELKEDGLEENTIVLFWSDHGNGLPRAKRWIYDSGTRVPMIAKIPAKYRNLVKGGEDHVSIENGSVDKRLISMIDLGPTMLTMAGLQVPSHMQGKNFWGEDAHEGHKYVFAGRDRVDERYDMVRMVRSNKFRYVRNYMPWYTWLRKIGYAENNVIRQEMRRKLADGSLHEASAQWLAPTRPYEELYDLSSDPHEIKNIAQDPAYANTLNELRSAMDQWVLKAGDVHLLAEPFQLEAELNGSHRRAKFEASDTSSLLKAAQTAANPKGKLAVLKEITAKGDPAVRWWGYMGLGYLSMSENADNVISALKQGLKDQHPAVRTAACWGLVEAGVINKEIESTLLKAFATNNPATRLWAATVLENITLKKPERKAEIAEASQKTPNNITIKGRDVKYFKAVMENYAGPSKSSKKKKNKK